MRKILYIPPIDTHFETTEINGLIELRTFITPDKLNSLIQNGYLVEE